MKTFEWTALFETGLGQVDAQHRRLVELVNQLGEDLDSASSEHIDQTLQALAEYTGYHFACEEAIMTAAGVAAAHADRHRETHRRFILQVGDWLARRKAGEAISLRQLLDFLANWLIFHILGDDQSLGRQVVAIGAGTAPQVACDRDRASDDPRTDILLGALRRLYGGLVARNEELIRAQGALSALNATLEQRVAERTAELVEANQRLKGITDSLYEGVMVVNAHGRIVFANPAVERLLDSGRDLGDPDGCPLDAVMTVRTRSGDVGFAGSSFRRALEGDGTIRDDDAVFVTAAGKAVAVAYACAPMGAGGAGRSVIVSFHDVGMLRAAQREALQASRQASVGQLAAGLAHEINTPVQYVGDNLRFIDGALAKLTAVVEAGQDLAAAARMGRAASRFEAVAESVKLPRLLAETPAAVRESLEGVEQIARIILSMKEFSHPGTGVKTATDINRALESTLTVSHNEWAPVATVAMDFAPSLPPALCFASEMNQVFLNLIVNAAQAIEASGKPLPGRITVTTSSYGDAIEIRVADSGAGVPAALRERIFDPFFTTKEVGQGIGQGLAICRDVVVVKHGGAMEVMENEGGGAVFIVRLPIDGGDAAAG